MNMQTQRETPQVIQPRHRITVDGQTALMREYTDCGMVTPHKLSEAGATCGICGREVIRDGKQPAKR